MKSPFPGMDPYLEKHWRDVHHSFLTYAPLDLQAIIDRCYQNGRYDDIDYHREPSEPLPPIHAQWSHELLTSQGRR